MRLLCRSYIKKGRLPEGYSKPLNNYPAIRNIPTQRRRDFRNRCCIAASPVLSIPFLLPPGDVPGGFFEVPARERAS